MTRFLLRVGSKAWVLGIALHTFTTFPLKARRREKAERHTFRT